MFQNIWYQLGRLIVSFYVRFVMRADIHQPTPMPKGAKIFVVNHPCTNDPAFVTVLTNEQTTILIKETLFKVPVFGRSLRMAGHVPVEAGKGLTALEEGIRLVKAGRTVIIFPEGEISPEDGFNKAHSGAARLALATGAPVIPIGISLNPKKLRLVQTIVEGKAETGTWYLRGPYAMTVGEAVTFQGSPEDRALVHKVTNQMMEQVSMLCQHGRRRLALRALQARPLARQLGVGTRLALRAPKAAAQFAWRAPLRAFQHSTGLIMRSPLFRTVESMVVFLLIYARNFPN